MEINSRSQGNCQKMCPAAEIRMRIRENLVHPLEKVSKAGKCDPNLMVKSYSRSAAGRHEIPTQDLRPGPVLCSTVEYLLGRVSTNTELPWVEVYDFIFDRLRAVRQDLTIQQTDGQEAVTVLEYAVRFYIYSGYRLCEEPFERFDPKINGQHTQECLKQLLSLYSTCDSHLVYRAEFESLYLIFNLGQTEALQHYYELPMGLRNNHLVKMAYKASVAYCLRNYTRVLKCLSSDLFSRQPLLLCAFHSNLTQLQLNALRVMSHGFSSKVLRYPLQHLPDMLWFDGLSVCQSFCEACSIQILQEEWVIFLKTSFREPEKLKPVRIAGIDSMLCKRPLGEVLLHKNLQSSDHTVLKTNPSEPYKPSLSCDPRTNPTEPCIPRSTCDPRTNPTEPCKSTLTCISGTNKTWVGRGRGRGRGRKGQEDKHSKTQVQGVLTTEGHSLNIDSVQGRHWENRTKICEIKRENESERTKCNEKTGTLNVHKSKDNLPVPSELWEDECFTDKDMIKS